MSSRKEKNLEEIIKQNFQITPGKDDLSRDFFLNQRKKILKHPHQLGRELIWNMKEKVLLVENQDLTAPAFPQAGMTKGWNWQYWKRGK